MQVAVFGPFVLSKTESKGIESVCVFVTMSVVVFTARCYASAVLAVDLCLSMSVHLSQVSVLSKWLNISSWILARELPSIRPTLCLEEIRLSPKIRTLPSGTLP